MQGVGLQQGKETATYLSSNKMIKGILGIIGCPVLDDEIIYSLYQDLDEKKVYVIDTSPSDTLKAKLESKGIPFTLIDEWSFQNGYADIDKENCFNIVSYMNKLGLHSRPQILRKTLEDQLKDCQGRVDVIALYYGSCGNAGWDVSRWASDTLDIPVFVFRDECGDVCDDCIGVAVGGHKRYCDFVKRYPGMFYVTPSIAGNWEEYSTELDFTKGFEIMNIYTIKEVFEVYGYKNAVKIDTGIGIQKEEYDKACERFSEETGLKLLDADPDAVDLYPTERLYLDAKTALGP